MKEMKEGMMYPVYSTKMATFLCQRKHSIHRFIQDPKCSEKFGCMFKWSDKLKDDIDEWMLLRERNSIRGYQRRTNKFKANMYIEGD